MSWDLTEITILVLVILTFIGFAVRYINQYFKNKRELALKEYYEQKRKLEEKSKADPIVDVLDRVVRALTGSKPIHRPPQSDDDNKD